MNKDTKVTTKRFLESGFKFVNGDQIEDLSGRVYTAGKEVALIHSNNIDDYDDRRYVRKLVTRIEPIDIPNDGSLMLDTNNGLQKIADIELGSIRSWTPSLDSLMTEYKPLIAKGVWAELWVICPYGCDTKNRLDYKKTNQCECSKCGKIFEYYHPLMSKEGR